MRAEPGSGAEQLAHRLATADHRALAVRARLQCGYFVPLGAGLLGIRLDRQQFAVQRPIQRNLS